MSDYLLRIAGLERRLRRYAVNDKIDIAAFLMFGDVELTIAVSKALLEKCPAFDVIVTPEAKSIPLAYEMARQSGKPYIVVRKGPKVYMSRPLTIQLHSITTQHPQTLYLGEEDAQKLKNKRALVVDDVVSTGESLTAVQTLVGRAGGIVAAKCAALAEGDAAKRADLLYLEELPLFEK